MISLAPQSREGSPSLREFVVLALSFYRRLYIRETVISVLTMSRSAHWQVPRKGLSSSAGAR
jgi:hypothetical protein